MNPPRPSANLGHSASACGSRRGFAGESLGPGGARLAGMPALITWWNRDLQQLLDRGDGADRAGVPRDDARREDARREDARRKDIGRVGADLLRRWGQPQRRYHTTGHLVEVFWALDELGEDAGLSEHEGVLARVAGWFHDAVYDPRAATGANESESAQLVRDTLPVLGVDATDVDTVEQLVRLTEGHEATDDRALTWAFLDSDLWILSSPAKRFDAYCEQVRQEYEHVAPAAYGSGRRAVLEPLLARATIYRTRQARATWEANARANLARELARLPDGRR